MTYIEQKQAAQSESDAHEENPHAAPEVEESQSVNLTIKVHKRQRLHWLIEAKKQGTSLTAAITDALNGRFGPPE